MKLNKMLKVIFKAHNLKIIDCNEYDDKNFNKKFQKLTQGREVSLAFVTNKVNKMLRKLDDKKPKKPKSQRAFDPVRDLPQ